ncbi:MAG: Cyclic-di-AMP phosphodiesterase PgpH [Candidatus Dichloromethanomonas elyunquensis]|nr:MAG: Cyclic-di-AMP phosphodiesterase PgpH [Candidatus Dichloromethanomonas elyunquensis]
MDLDKKIKKMLSPKVPYKNFKFKYQVSVFILFFLLFTSVIASGLFGSKLNVELGEPSPQLITAPYTKEITDLTTYREEQESAANAVTPVYAADESQISFLTEDISHCFRLLKQQNTDKIEISQAITELRKTLPFSILPDSTLQALLAMTDNDMEKSEQTVSRIVTGIAKDPNSGAKFQSEVSLLKDRMKEQVNKSGLTNNMKAFSQAYVDLRVTKPTLIIDPEETQRLKEIASSKIKPLVHTYVENEKIVGPGEIVDERVSQVLLAYGLIEVKSPWKPTGGIAILVFVSMIILMIFSYQITPDIIQKWKRLVLIGLLIFLVLTLGKAFMAINLGKSDLNNLTAVLVPAAWVTMTVTILLGVRIAVVVGIILGVFVGSMADPAAAGASGSLAGLFSLIGGLVGIQSVARLDQRSDLARAGLFVALVNVALICGAALILNLNAAYWLIGCAFALANGLLASVLTMGTLPWFESGFNITSAVRLLELSNPNAPLLKELLMEAPGTYHHSVLVGNLAETAAEEIKADPVLVRVGALYHDIGKLKRPYFFIENQFTKDNPHDKIAPTLSSLIVISHVKDGLEMAKEHKLPESLRDIIAQHHGDSLASYFYHKALEENPDIPEEAFRYDGIRPQSKEAALVLLADNVEAAVRSQKGNTPGRIEGLVRKIIKEKFDEGLLDQCDLTFKDLDKISIAFVKVLSGIFHTRIEYPELSPSKLRIVEAARPVQNDGEAKEENEKKND